MEQQKNIKLNGLIRGFLACPLWLLLFLVGINVIIYFLDSNSGVTMSVGLVIYAIIAMVYYYGRKAVISRELITFATSYGQIQRQLLKELDLPYAVLDYSGKLLWFNDSFAEITGKENHNYKRSITNLFSGITLDALPTKEMDETEIHMKYDGVDYRVIIQSLDVDDFVEEFGLDTFDSELQIYALYLYDETELKKYIRMYEEETMVTGFIYLDNYEEALENVEDVRQSLLTALIDRRINKYFADLDGLVRKFERDKYFFVMRSRSLEELKELKFSILEEVKGVNVGNNMSITISIGVAANGGSYAKNAENARRAIEFALGRGGDQAVLKDGDKIFYYGGKTQAVEKNTRVKARVKAHALKEFMDTKERIIVMGHKITDVDSFGAAIGIYRAGKTLKKDVNIVVDVPTTSIKPMMESFQKDPDYDEHMFVSCKEALDLAGEEAMLVVVDTNKPSYTECEELLYRIKTIVVLDHHRQSSDVIRNASLSYIEPYASSACEMVAEILQYFADDVKLRNLEADAIYAGIMIDTDNFLQKTGVRTFEAAAFLRRCGADVTRVRKMFRENMEDYKTRGEVIRNAELFRSAFAISVCPAEHIESPTVVGAKAANALLNIMGVRASFVLTEFHGQIYISARAIDEINVQLVMERMGGGGHLNIAGVQLEGVSIEQAKERLKATLVEMLDGGEI